MDLVKPRYIGEHPSRGNTEATCESRESVETTREASMKNEDDIVRAVQQCTEAGRNDWSLPN